LIHSAHLGLYFTTAQTVINCTLKICPGERVHRKCAGKVAVNVSYTNHHLANKWSNSVSKYCTGVQLNTVQIVGMLIAFILKKFL